MEIFKRNEKILSIIKSEKPLIHCITNYVTANDSANMILSIGASPVMADSIHEVKEMVSCASALVINLGTLNEKSITSMKVASMEANRLGIPVILDPVGVGATKYRIETAQMLIENIDFSVIKGNLAEIKTLCHMKTSIKGVDSVDDNENGIIAAKKLALKLNTIVAITGKEDVISDGQITCTIKNGKPFLSKITGTGCMSTCLVASLMGAISNSFDATVLGICMMGIAGEKALLKSDKKVDIGQLKCQLFDEIYNFSMDDFFQYGHLMFSEDSTESFKMPFLMNNNYEKTIKSPVVTMPLKINKSSIDYSLYLVTDQLINGDKDFLKSIEKAILGGAGIIQLREKNISTANFYHLACQVKSITSRYNVPLIINDRIDIALAIDADGIHIGQNDIPLSIAKELLPKDKIIGVSTSTLELAIKAESEGADYVGVGAIFPTKTKDHTVSVSLDTLKKIKSTLSIPVVAIGGIHHDNVHLIAQTHADGVAVVSAIFNANDTQQATISLKKQFKNHKF